MKVIVYSSSGLHAAQVDVAPAALFVHWWCSHERSEDDGARSRDYAFDTVKMLRNRPSYWSSEMDTSEKNPR